MTANAKNRMQGLALVALLAFLGGCVTKGYVLEHTAIDIANPEETAAWWVENLGFEITAQLDNEMHTTFIVDRTGRIAIEMYRSLDGVPPPDYQSMRTDELHFGFVSEDVDADIARLTAAGAKLVKRDTSPVVDNAILKDPSGLSIQFIKRANPVLKR